MNSASSRKFTLSFMEFTKVLLRFDFQVVKMRSIGTFLLCNRDFEQLQSTDGNPHTILQMDFYDNNSLALNLYITVIGTAGQKSEQQLDH